MRALSGMDKTKQELLLQAIESDAVIQGNSGNIPDNYLIKQSKHNENFVVFALVPLENKTFAKTLGKLSKKYIFRISD